MFHVSRGSAETQVRRGRITNHHSIAYWLSNISAKSYQNRSMCVEVILCSFSIVFTVRRYAKCGIMPSSCVCPSVCVCLSHSGIVSKRLNVRSRKYCHCPWKGRGYVTWPILNVGGPIHISGMAETIAIKFCTQEGYIKSYQRNKKNHPKRDVTWPI